MTDTYDRDRMGFETMELRKRAVRIRAGIDGVKSAGVVNAALEVYLAREIAIAKQRLKKD